MIIDDALARGRKTYGLSRPQWERLVNARRRAESFVFTDSAATLMGRFAAECGELVLRNRQFAVPPFNDLYIELSARHFTAPLSGRSAKDSEISRRIGYLVSGRSFFTFVTIKGGSYLLPLYWSVTQPGQPLVLDEMGPAISFSKILEVEDQDVETTILGLALGSTYQKIHDEDERQSLLKEFAWQFQGHEYLLDEARTDDKAIMADMLRAGTGDLRNLWTILLWLNRPVHTNITNMPPSRRFISGKQVVYKAHRIVEIDLHKFKSIRRAFTLSGPRLSPRRHHVRGAFHHSGGTQDCSHEWPMTPDVDNIFSCRLCGKKRWWVKDHVRGDATRGWVSHEYAVTV